MGEDWGGGKRKGEGGIQMGEEERGGERKGEEDRKGKGRREGEKGERDVCQ